MAEEAILSVSLKDYKKQIDDLRASLLSLDNTSKEYQATAEEIKNKQAKLNEVMGVGKQSVDAVAGSYNALSQELSNLKKEWKNMEIGTKEWEATAKQIDKLNDKLKDADAKVGFFGRNVGNYSQSFIEAFSMVGGSAGKMGSAVAAGAKTANVALKALAANPIGAVIAAVALLVNGLVKAFKRNEDATNSLKKAMVPLKTVMVAVQRVFDVLATSIGKAAEAIGDFFGKLFGKDTEMAKIQSELNAIATSEEKLAKQQRETTIKNADAAKEVAELRNKAAQKSLYTEAERLAFLEEAGEKEKEISQRAYEDAKLQYEIIKKKNSLAESSTEDKQAEADAYAAMVNAETAYFNKTKEIAAQMSEIRNKDLNQVNEILKKIKENSQTEIQNLTDKYNKEKRLLEKYHKDTKALTEQYEKDITRIKNKEWQERIRQEEIYQSIYLSQFVTGSKSYYEEQLNGYMIAYKELNGIQKEIEKEIDKKQVSTQEERDKIYKDLYGYNSEADFNAAVNSAIANINTAKDNLQKTMEKDFQTQLSLKIFNVNEINPAQALAITYWEYKRFTENIKKLNEETDEEFELRKNEWVKKAKDTLVQWTLVSIEQNKMIDEQTDKYKALQRYVDTMPHSILEQIFSLPAGAEENLNKQFSMAYERYKEWNEFVEEYQRQVVNGYGESIGKDLSGFELNSEELAKEIGADKLRELLKLPPELFNKNIEVLTQYADAEKAVLEQRKNNYFALAAGISDCFGAIAQIYEEDIKAQVENNQMSEEIAREEYKKVQALKVSQAIIQTISGAISAFMGCQELGQPWGLILGGVQAAAVTAAGVAQIKQIQNQNPYGTSTNISSPVVTPRLNDYSPNRVSNITTAEDEKKLQETLNNTNIWVSVEDINSAQNKGRTRVAESTF